MGVSMSRLRHNKLSGPIAQRHAAWVIGPMLAAALVGGFTLITTGGRAEAQAANLTIVVGSGEAGYAVNQFGPNAVTVTAGSTLTFKNTWEEPHTVTFPGSKPVPPPSDPTWPVPTNPGVTVAFDGVTYLSSGMVAKGQTFDVKFPTAGTYRFVCIIHPGMEGTVTAVAAGGTASTQAQLDAAAQKSFGDTLTALKAEAAKQTAKGVTKETNTDGSTTWHVTVGGMVGTSDLQQFFLPTLSIKVGDTVVWESSIPTPHTATFLGGDKLPVPPIPENPLVMQPSKVAAGGYSGTGYLNSGIIGVGWPAKTFSAKFGAAGSFPYICILHVPQGMGGTITVAQVAPPKTGSAGTIGSAGAHAQPWAAAAALTLLVVLGARAVTARRPE